MNMLAELPCTGKSASWSMQDGIIKMEITTQALDPESYMKQHGNKNVRFLKKAEEILVSPAYRPISETCRLKIINVSQSIVRDRERRQDLFYDQMETRGYKKPSPCIALELFGQLKPQDIFDMGLWWIIVMHEPINGWLLDALYHPDISYFGACQFTF